MNGKGDNNESCNLCGSVCDPDSLHIDRGGRPDPCLGMIPGAIHACCGHGEDFYAYVVLADAEPGTACDSIPQNEITTLRGTEAIEFFSSLNIGPSKSNSDDPEFWPPGYLDGTEEYHENDWRL